MLLDATHCIPQLSDELSVGHLKKQESNQLVNTSIDSCDQPKY